MENREQNGNGTRELLSAAAWRIALQAARLLEGELDGEGDVKRAKDLAAILREMSQLARDLGGAGGSLRVEFIGLTGEGGV